MAAKMEGKKDHVHPRQRRRRRHPPHPNETRRPSKLSKLPRPTRTARNKEHGTSNFPLLTRFSSQTPALGECRNKVLLLLHVVSNNSSPASLLIQQVLPEQYSPLKYVSKMLRQQPTRMNNLILFVTYFKILWAPPPLPLPLPLPLPPLPLSPLPPLPLPPLPPLPPKVLLPLISLSMRVRTQHGKLQLERVFRPVKVLPVHFGLRPTAERSTCLLLFVHIQRWTMKIQSTRITKNDENL